MATRVALKNFFIRGAKPTAGQFASWIDSFWHKDEDQIPVEKIEGLSRALAGKASVEDLQNEAAVRTASDGSLQRQINSLTGSLDMSALIASAPVYANEAAASAAGLNPYTFYKTASGELRYRLPEENEAFTYTLPLILS